MSWIFSEVFTVPSHFKNQNKVEIWRPRVSAARLVLSRFWSRLGRESRSYFRWNSMLSFLGFVFLSRFCPDIFLLLGSYPDFVESQVPISHVFGQQYFFRNLRVSFLFELFINSDGTVIQCCCTCGKYGFLRVVVFQKQLGLLFVETLAPPTPKTEHAHENMKVLPFPPNPHQDRQPANGCP